MSWFSRKKETKQEIDLGGVLQTDIHSHLLPGIDDGAQTIDESISLIKEMEELGYKKMIITPHVRYGYFDNDTSTFDSRLEELKRNVKMAGINMEFEVGAEQSVDEEFSRRIENNELKSFGKNKYLLIEFFPFTEIPMGYKQTLFSLQTKGYNLILAHPERYLYLYNDEKTLEELKDRGMLFQMNIISLSGYFGEPVKKFAEKLIKNDMIDLLGTDLHGIRHINALKNTLHNVVLASLLDSGKIMNKKF
ncbi:MAG: capsular biosynthesis protein [Bacteroidales bacterium]|jgi:tyrosine-protein phosphatase YwqE|nr:capsular biosynthesis protein [Bacteroidales bacterium]